MKCLKKSFLFTMAILLIICNKGVAEVFATPNIKLEGNANGIVFIPGDEPFLTSMNMLPGDKIKRDIILDNKDNKPYKVFVRAERVTKKEKYDLLEKINLSIKYDGKKIYSGPVSGENGMEENICLGVVKPGETNILHASVDLDGKETGNEYKNKFGQVNWIFTAIKLEDNEEGSTIGIGNNNNNSKFKNNENKSIIPYTGDSGIRIYLAVTIIAFLLLIIINSRRKEKN
ncbi:LPXTG cell wall anchor domain-containing protein [Clostridium perfringens]|uniref:LPXTG cell wall anchor domain-containing protein n=1 Tax=Clostridium perfringens TaxID=1502 RepID=UPI003F43CD46